MPAITSIGQSVPLSGISNADYPASGTTLYDSRFENVRWKVDDHTTIIFNLLSVVLLSDIRNGLDFYYQFKVVSNPILYRPEPRPIRRPSLAFPFTWLAGYDTRILFADYYSDTTYGTLPPTSFLYGLPPDLSSLEGPPGNAFTFFFDELPTGGSTHLFFVGTDGITFGPDNGSMPLCTPSTLPGPVTVPIDHGPPPHLL